MTPNKKIRVLGSCCECDADLELSGHCSVHADHPVVRMVYVVKSDGANSQIIYFPHDDIELSGSSVTYAGDLCVDTASCRICSNLHSMMLLGNQFTMELNAKISRIEGGFYRGVSEDHGLDVVARSPQRALGFMLREMGEGILQSWPLKIEEEG